MSADVPSTLRRRLEGHHIPALDGVRGISAFLVVFAHLGLLPQKFGALGVSIFFVLSGFLITWLMLREVDKTGTLSLTKFYVRRTLRIFPAFYCFWVVALAAAWVEGWTFPGAPPGALSFTSEITTPH